MDKGVNAGDVTQPNRLRRIITTMAKYGSAFNLRGCQTVGGMGGGGGSGQCDLNLSGPFEIAVSRDQSPLINMLRQKKVTVLTYNEVTQQNEPTEVYLLSNTDVAELTVANQELGDYVPMAEVQTSITNQFDLATTIRQTIRDTIERRGALEYKRVAMEVVLTYECPKVGDALRWNHATNSYDKAFARTDPNALRMSDGTIDTEHLIDVVGIVESVTTSCTGEVHGDFGDSVGPATNAVMVMSGLIEFDLHPENYLVNGATYYLWDGLRNEDVALGNNVTNGNTYEPPISKPLFLAMSETTALVTNYRPLTGSSTGGKALTEEYEVQVTLTPGGWKVKVINIGNMGSGFPLVAQLVYNRLDGSDTVYFYEEVGLLKSRSVAAIDPNDSLHSSYEFNVTKDSVHGINYDAQDGVNGVGSLFVELKVNARHVKGSQLQTLRQTSTIEKSDKAVLSLPNLKLTPTCADFENENTPNSVWQVDGQHGDVALTDGAMFEIELREGNLWVDENPPLYRADPNNPGQPLPVTWRISMPQHIGAKMESDALSEHIQAQFKLDDVENTAVEIFPSTDSGDGIVARRVSLELTNTDGTALAENHWANYLTTALTDGKVSIECDPLSCCRPSSNIVIPSNRGVEVNLSEILDKDTLIGNLSGAKFYTMNPDEASPVVYDTEDGLRVAWKNMRENTTFCYPKSVSYGTQPAFMTIYSNSAKTLGAPSEANSRRGARFYDPRHTLIEIGAQETLNGEFVKLTLNANNAQGRQECCYEFKFMGSLEGTHWTIEELFREDLMIHSSAGCINQG